VTNVYVRGQSPYGLCPFRKIHIETGYEVRVAGIQWAPSEVNDVVSEV
jgi:hypothetical protein